jgi:hypothetical protein
MTEVERCLESPLTSSVGMYKLLSKALLGFQWQPESENWSPAQMHDFYVALRSNIISEPLIAVSDMGMKNQISACLVCLQEDDRVEHIPIC